MNTHQTLLATCILFLSFFLSVPQHAFATVGGETFVYDFTYNPSDESVYYTQIDRSGRGCPPELKKISLNSEKPTVVFSCDQGEKLTEEQVNSQINLITSKFKPLVPVSLKSNAISADIRFIKVETYDSESKDVLMRHFALDIYQHGKKIKEFEVTGCTLAQPFTIQGYSIPGFDKKIILLISAKNNCYEGGYIYETMKVLGGVDNLDKTVMNNFYKGPSPLLPNEGNLVTYESDKVNTAMTASTSIITELITIISEEIKTDSWWTKLINWFRNLF
jgi:hypothetical protein